MISNSFAILSPPVITEVMQQTQDVLTLPMPLLWYERAAKPNVTGREMTMKETTHVYASDIIAMDAVAHVREAGQFSFQQHGSNKLKHGVWFSEEMIDLIWQLGRGTLGDIGTFSLQSYLGRWAQALELGRQQRAEAMLNGMLADSFTYDRLGIKIDASFGMRSDLKFSVTEPWRDPDGSVNADAKPLSDMVAALFYARRHYGEGYDRFTLTDYAYTAIVGTTEFKETYKATAFQYAQTSDAATNAQAANPYFYLGFIANFISAAMRRQNGQAGGRPVTVEIYDGQYREYSASGEVGTLVPFHPADNLVTITNSADDGSSSGWDLGNGPCKESIMSDLLKMMGGATTWSTLTDFSGVVPWGPLGYVCPSNINMNPPNFQMWNVGWVAPRKHRDTCSARIKIWPDA